MNLSDIINPWRALRCARQHRDDLYVELLAADRKVDQCERELREARLRAGLAKADIVRLEAALKEAHFRNPKTGRLGRKGERF